MRAVIGLILAISILLPLVMVSINAISAGQLNEANSTSSSSIDPTKLTKSERKKLIDSYTGNLTEEQKKEFIETGSISATATPSEKVTSSPSTSTTTK
jgi:hypothetical protein